jgi:hypothetical protein
MRFSIEPDEGYPLTLPSPTRGEGKGTRRILAPAADARVKHGHDDFHSVENFPLDNIPSIE